MINYVSENYIIPEINKSLPGTTFPDTEEVSSGVDIKLSNTTLDSFHIDLNNTYTEFKNQELVSHMKIVNISLSFDYIAKSRFFSSHDLGNIQVDWMNFVIYVQVKNDQGKIFV